MTTTNDNARTATGSKQRQQLEGKDELGLTSILERFQYPASETLNDLLSKAAVGYWNSDKEWAKAEPLEGVYPVTLKRQTVLDPNHPKGEREIAVEQVVPVFIWEPGTERQMGAPFLIHRTHTRRTFTTNDAGEMVADENGRYRYNDYYDCTYIRVPDVDEAVALMRDLRTAIEFASMRSLFGGMPSTSAPSALRADEVDEGASELIGQPQARPSKRSTKK